MRLRWLGIVSAVGSLLFAGLSADGEPPHGEEGPRVGEATPSIAAVDAAGDSYHLEKSLKGKIVLLTFWTLDPKSLSGMPLERLGGLSRRFADDERFQIVTVCINGIDDWDAWSEFWVRHVRGGSKVPRFGGRHWWVLMQSDAEEPTTAQRFAVQDPPAYYLIDGDGRLAAVRVPPEELEEGIGRLLKPTSDR